MNRNNNILTAVLSVILTVQFCDTNASILDDRSGIEKSYDYRDHPRQIRSVSSVNDSAEKNFNASITSTTEIPKPLPIKIIDQKYSQNTSGEYKHE